MNVPVELSRIVITELGDEQLIYLKEKDGKRSFPIRIGIAEALAIDRRLKGVKPPRPMTHELLSSVIEAMGGSLEKIVISDIRDHVFIATLTLRLDHKLLEVDSRPSDAIALGVATDTPIFVAERVFDGLNQAPDSKQVRVLLLQKRLEVLRRRIADLETQLNNDDFLAKTSPTTVADRRKQLSEMQSEYSAIERVLGKIG
ncbi:MAG: bifunctional nuclease domain-containing protein [Planctomycetota bacterium]|nr:bifunctional nuclease domain-containing protein [Planctomycetota bacterium]